VLLAGVFLPAATLCQEQGSTEQEKSTAPLPRGKKLMLKDGSYQLVRSYEIQGDHVRYYSVERSQWEEIPSSLVDWDLTKKVAADEAKQDEALVEKAHAAEEAKRYQPVDVDASVEAAPGVFLPPGEGAFILDGKALLSLTQAEAGSKLSKGRVFEQVMVPIPIIPSRHVISLKGARAKFRISNPEPEFFMRTADGREPRMDLIRAAVHGDSRQIANVDTLFKHQVETRNSLSLQSWTIAKGVYRFTLGEALQPGEYVLAEIMQGDEGGMNLYVWDFGVDPATKPAAK
jgi:hypothetical protein